MAKNTKPETPEINEEELIMPESKMPDPEELVDVTVMTEGEGVGQTIFCSVNGTAIYVPCGEPVKIKRKYAEVLKRRQEELVRTAKKNASLVKEASSI